MNNPLIIRGGIYYADEILLIPHYTGFFHTVDCTEYKTKKQIKAEYNKETANIFLNGSCYLKHEGRKYYKCEYNPHYTESFELLNDVSDLEFTDDQIEF